MQIWLDTTDTTHIQTAKDMGILYGITTNPIILGGSFASKKSVIEHLLLLQDGPVAVQVSGTSHQQMQLEAQSLMEFSSRIIVKIPSTPDGYACLKEMHAKNCPIMATTIIEAQQILCASIIGANYAAIYLNAIQEIQGDYIDELKRMLTIIREQNFKTKVLAASIKSVDQVLTCAENGVPAITLSANVFNQVMKVNDVVIDYIRKFSNSSQ